MTDGRTCGGGIGHHSTNHPVGAAPVAAETHEINVFIRDAAEEAENMLYLQDLALLPDLVRPLRRTSTLDVVPLGHDASNTVAHIAVRLSCGTSILRLLAAASNVAREIEHLTPSRLTAPLDEIGMKRLINEELSTAETYQAENVQNEREELNVIDRAGQAEVAEVSWAVMIRLTTTAARLSII
jgi:hypothetical protein